MSFKPLAISVALSALIAAPAFADENFANVHQSGSGNEGAVVQGPGSLNAFGTETLAARQSGDDNVLTIVQSGSGNEIGTGLSGFLQTSNHNVAKITQSSSNNSVSNVVQTGIGDFFLGQLLPRNYLNLTQKGGDSNQVALVAQTRESSNPAFDPLPGNSAILSFEGADNGAGHLSSSGPAGAWGGVAENSIVQTGNTNTLAIATVGDANQFGYDQDGGGNGVLAGISGDRNQTVVVQEGILNNAGFTVSGSDNQLFIRQGLEDTNLAGVLLFGDDNRIGLQQLGSSNIATLTINGDNNLVNAYQDGTNDLFVDIRGDNNNSSSFMLGQPAGLTATASALQPGDVLQFGSENLIDYSVGLTSMNADNNSFAFLQDGDNNRIIGATFGGTGNEVVIVQNGSGNYTSFTQNGSGNIIGVSQ